MTVLLPFLAFLLISAGTYRQSQLLFGRLPPFKARVAAIVAGYLVLALSLALRLSDGGTAIVRWFGDLTLAASAVVGLAAALTAIEARRRSRHAPAAHSTVTDLARLRG